MVLSQSEIPSINQEEKEKCFKLDANYENEHKCDRAEIETIDPNCRFRSQSAHRPRLVLIGDFPVTHSFLQPAHTFGDAYHLYFLVLHRALLIVIGYSILQPTRFCRRIVDYSFLFAPLPKALIPTCQENFILDASLCSVNYVSFLPSFLHLAASKPK